MSKTTDKENFSGNDFRSKKLKDIGLRLRALREQFLLTRSAMAKLVLISRGLLIELEDGERMPSGPLLIALETFFLANKRWILTGRGEMILDNDPLYTYESVVDPTETEGLDWKDHYKEVELAAGLNGISTEGKEKVLQFLRSLTVQRLKIKRA